MNSTKRCKQCKEYKPSATGQQCPCGWFCCFACSAKYGIEASKRETQKRLDKALSARKKANSKALCALNKSDIKWQKARTQAVFNRMRVLEEKLWFSLRGQVPTCISCNRPNMDWCCGHYKTRGAQSSLRYDRKNTYLQCNFHCNKNLSGNIEGNKSSRGLKQGLYDRFGKDEAESILAYCNSMTRPVSLSCEQLELMRAEFSARARELKKRLAI